MIPFDLLKALKPDRTQRKEGRLRGGILIVESVIFHLCNQKTQSNINRNGVVRDYVLEGEKSIVDTSCPNVTWKKKDYL